MTTEKIIEMGVKNFNTYIALIKKPIDFEELEARHFRSVVDGRKTAFEAASSQLTKLKQEEEQLGVFQDKVHRKRLEQQVKASEGIWEQIGLLMDMEISEDDVEDERVKVVVQAKDMGYELLRMILAVKKSIEQKLDSNESLASTGSRNIATEFAKNR
jgi:hypothetical protein